MNLSVIDELKKFEEEQRLKLDARKKEYQQKLEKKKKEIQEKNAAELYELKIKKHLILKKAAEKAHQSSTESTSKFRDKTAQLDHSRAKMDHAVDIIMDEFKNV